MARHDGDGDGCPGKTAPRLLHDLLTYDPRYVSRAGRNLLATVPPHFNPHTNAHQPAVPHRNCRHGFLNKKEQCHLPVSGDDLENAQFYKVASFCPSCRWHVDLFVDFRNNGYSDEPCRKDSEYPLHHFIFDPDGQLYNPTGESIKDLEHPDVYRGLEHFHFYCSAPKCPAKLRITMKPPRFSEADVTLLTNSAVLRQRWEAAKQIAGERADTAMARTVDAPDFLNTYLQDSLTPKPGKTRIPLLNRKFLKTFGRDCDQLLQRLGFTKEYELDEDGSETVQVWLLPKPPESRSPLEINQRNVVEDARYELNTMILTFAENERQGARHIAMYPTPSQNDFETALGCRDYNKAKGRPETRSTSHEEDHPYYAGLGTVGDFADPLLKFAFDRQISNDPKNASYYFECLQDLAVGRQSDFLETEVAMLASTGLSNRLEVNHAYAFFGMNPQHAEALNDDHIIGVFRSRLSDTGPDVAEETRRQLRIIGNARKSDLILQESSDAIETYEQALSWLDLNPESGDDFVTAMYSLRTNDSPSNVETARKAVSIIAEYRGSTRLRSFLDTGAMSEPEMDLAEAYAMFNVSDRSKVDHSVLDSTASSHLVDDPTNVAKTNHALELIRKDQADNYHNERRDENAEKQAHPLESWPVGLSNIGNTCYLASVLQFLFTVRPLRNLVLDCENHLQETTEEALKDKRVGRTVVTADRVETAQKFLRELRSFFLYMIDAPVDSVQPARELAALALMKSDMADLAADNASTNVANNGAEAPRSLGEIEGLPVSGPSLPPDHKLDEKAMPISPPDSTMGDENEGRQSDTNSMAAMDLGEQENSSNKPEPPSRPPPVPPRPQPSNDAKIQARLEDVARQQDAAEVLNNIFDLMSCALKGSSMMQDNEQIDLIKELFYSTVTTVRKRDGKTSEKSDLHDNILISTKGRDRHIYAALDDEFGLAEVDDGSEKYEYIATPSPIQIFNIRRLQMDGERPTKDQSHVNMDKVLYLDRYLHRTKSRSEAQLQQLREVQWEKQQQLKKLTARRKGLVETDLNKMSLPDVLCETAKFLENSTNAKENEEEQLVASEAPEVMRDKAQALRSEIGQIDESMAQLESEVDTVFHDCKDHPYLLHSVFIHRGGTTGGHYYIYIYDFQNDLWRRYNDDRVESVDEAAIFEKVDGTVPPTSTGIVYIRADQANHLTEAVCRNPDLGQGQGDIDMPDARDDMQPSAHDTAPMSVDDQQWENLPVIDGVDKE